MHCWHRGTGAYVGAGVINAGYPRHYFPLSEMTQDCGWYVVPYGTLPAGESFACGRRWAGGVGFSGTPTCQVKSIDDRILHNCSNSGGNSGSPLIAYTSGQVFGVTGGVGHNFDIGTNPQCSSDPNAGWNYAANASRFIYAPRRAGNVAVASRADGAAATGVFATDLDTKEVKYRARTGSPLNFQSPFTEWSSLGAVPNASLVGLGSLAACKQTPSNPTPRVFVLTSFLGNPTLYTKVAPFSGAWSNFTLPGSGYATDVDANYEVVQGRCQVYVVRGGSIYTRWMTGEGSWSTWATVWAGNYVKITAQNVAGVFFLFMLKADGQIWWTKYTGSWSTPSQAGVALPAGVTAWTDIDLGFDSVPNSVLYAYAGGNKLWSKVIPSSGAFGAWNSVTTTLYRTGGGDGTAPTLNSINASRWQEAGGTTSALFGTDAYGNVYVLASGSDTRWKSFYSEYIPTAP